MYWYFICIFMYFILDLFSLHSASLFFFSWSVFVCYFSLFFILLLSFSGSFVHLAIFSLVWNNYIFRPLHPIYFFGGVRSPYYLYNGYLLFALFFFSQLTFLSLYYFFSLNCLLLFTYRTHYSLFPYGTLYLLTWPTVLAHSFLILSFDLLYLYVFFWLSFLIWSYFLSSSIQLLLIALIALLLLSLFDYLKVLF